MNPLLVVSQRLEANTAALIINRPARRCPQRHRTLPRRGEALPERRRRSARPRVPRHDFKTPRRPRRPRVGLGRRLRPVREGRAESRVRAVDGREAGRGQLGAKSPCARGRRPRRARSMLSSRRRRRRRARPSLGDWRPGRRRRLRSARAAWRGLALAQRRPRRIHRRRGCGGRGCATSGTSGSPAPRRCEATFSAGSLAALAAFDTTHVLASFLF